MRVEILLGAVAGIVVSASVLAVGSVVVIGLWAKVAEGIEAVIGEWPDEEDDW